MSKMKEMTLSVCMIVKNEEAVIEDCLKSVSGIADQIVVVDTGSTDKTIEIAEKYNAEIHHFEWIHDFAAARNESIKYATGDWILWLDADEQLEEDSVKRLKRVLRKEKQTICYKINIRNLKQGGSHYMISDAHRLFMNNRGIRFNGRIHEQIVESAKKVKAIERESDIFLYHLGYSYEGEQAQKKSDRNLELLLKLVEDEPESAYAHFTLAQNYGLSDKHENALEQYAIALKYKNQLTANLLASLYNSMGESLMKLNQYDKAAESAQLSLQTQKIQSGAWYLLYRIANEKEEFAEAADYLEKVREMTKQINRSGKSISSDIQINDEKLLTVLSSLYQKSGNYTKALSCLNTNKNLEKSGIMVRRILEIYQCSGDFNMVAEQLAALTSLTDEELTLIKNLGILFIRQEAYDKAIFIFERVVALMPKDIDSVKKLIGLYGKTGQIEKANSLVQFLR